MFELFWAAGVGVFGIYVLRGSRFDSRGFGRLLLLGAFGVEGAVFSLRFFWYKPWTRNTKPLNLRSLRLRSELGGGIVGVSVWSCFGSEIPLVEFRKLNP